MKPSAPRPPRRRRLLAWAAALLAAYLILGTALPFVCLLYTSDAADE